MEDSSYFKVTHTKNLQINRKTYSRFRSLWR